jgi:hypothetical protein
MFYSMEAVLHKSKAWTIQVIYETFHTECAHVSQQWLFQVVLGQSFFPPLNIIPLWLSTLIYYLGMNNWPAGGHSSETYSHPINRNINNNGYFISLSQFHKDGSIGHCPRYKAQGGQQMS